MNRIGLIMSILYALSFSACGQTTNGKKANIKSETIQMDTSKLTNPTIRQVFDAWQNGDAKTFLSFFVAEAKLYDDGNQRDFLKFVHDACGHEKFTSIDKVENNGLAIYGQFHTESWGDFKTYFKFYLNNEGKITRLDIGQAN